VVRLYVYPSAHASMLGVDEKSSIQALDPILSGLPLKPNRRGTTAHDESGMVTTTLFLALDVVIGRYISEGETQPHPSSILPLSDAYQALDSIQQLQIR
jgi:hypothetical protein